MNAEDLTPNRLQSIKNQLKLFSKTKKQDRFGLVTFDKDILSITPLSRYTSTFVQKLDSVTLQSGSNSDGLGKALATGLNRLHASTSAKKIMILITDSSEPPLSSLAKSAFILAKKRGIIIHTIGIGSEVGVRIPILDPKHGKQYLKNTKTKKPILTTFHSTAFEPILPLTLGKFLVVTSEDSLLTAFSSLSESTTDNTIVDIGKNSLTPFLLGAVLIILIFELLIRFRLRLLP
ncbi:hypothetical protein DID77_02440 [Candidatus Marinamargulisbacteria bacterium SCGC AG-439-L15]|nr:hypothetical protein DID77_02440 [Candidatus Marinamargulisbacteria bacterium SCGC AG-439-L15]